MDISQEWVEETKRNIRAKSSEADQEVKGLIEACLKDLEIAGVYVTDAEDPLVKQAVKLYCKGNYGYDDDTERFRELKNGDWKDEKEFTTLDEAKEYINTTLNITEEEPGGGV